MIKAPTIENKYSVYLPEEDGSGWWLIDEGNQVRWAPHSEIEEKNIKPSKFSAEEVQHFASQNPQVLAIDDSGKIVKKVEPKKPEPQQPKAVSNKGVRRKGASEKGDSGESKPKGVWLIWLLRFLLLSTAFMVGLYLLYRSYGLYQITFKKWDLFTINKVCPSFKLIPLVGGWIAGGCLNLAKTVSGALPIFTLISLTVLQSLITFALFCPGFIRWLVDILRWNRRTDKQLQTEEGDTPGIKRMVDRHNRISETTLKNLMIASFAGFIAEAYILWVARSGRADVGSVLVDALGLDLLLLVALVVNNLFTAKPPRKVRRYSGA